MAISVQDKAGNVTVTTSGTVTSVDSPVYFGKALEFNTLSGGSIADTNGKLEFEIPTGEIGSGDFTVEGFISVSKNGGSYNHADFFLDLPALGYRLKTNTVSGKLGFIIQKPDASQVSGGSATITDETYAHFMLTRESGTIKFYSFGAFQQTSLETGNTHDFGGDTVELGDLHGPQTALFRIDAFRISDTVRNSPSGSSYNIPGADSSVENVGSDTIVLLDGSSITIENATINASASTTLSANAGIVGVDSALLQSTASLSSSATRQPGVRASLSGKVFFEDGYVESGYIDTTYFRALLADSFDAGAASISANSSVSVSAGVIESAQADLSSSAVIGTQNYVEANYIEAGYFEHTTDAEVIQLGANLSSTVTVSVSADEEGEANLTANVHVGDFYVVPTYIERGYFVEGVEAQSLVGAVVSTNISGTVSAEANTKLDAQASLSSTASMSGSAGSTFDGNASLSSSVSVSAFAGEITPGTVSVAIAATTSIDVNAELAGEVSVAIAATTSIQANATSSGDIEPGITVTLTCDAGAIRPNDRYTLLIPRETRVNTITEETRSLQIPRETRELEFLT